MAGGRDEGEGEGARNDARPGEAGSSFHSRGGIRTGDNDARGGCHLLPLSFGGGLIVATAPAPHRGGRAVVQPPAKESTVAEIKVENRDDRGVPPREGGFKWWWLLPLLLIPLLLFTCRGRDDDADEAPVVTDTTVVAPAPVAAPMAVDTTPVAPAGMDTMATGATGAGTTGTGTGTTGTTQDTTTTDTAAPRP